MKLTLNGEARESTARTLKDLVDELGLRDHAVAVEINKEVVPKNRHDQTSLSDGDVIELVTFVGGG